MAQHTQPWKGQVTFYSKEQELSAETDKPNAYVIPRLRITLKITQFSIDFTEELVLCELWVLG